MITAKQAYANHMRHDHPFACSVSPAIAGAPLHVNLKREGGILRLGNRVFEYTPQRRASVVLLAPDGRLLSRGGWHHREWLRELKQINTPMRPLRLKGGAA